MFNASRSERASRISIPPGNSSPVCTRLRDDRFLETQLRSFAQAGVHLPHPAQLAGQAHFADQHSVRADRSVFA